MKAARYSLYVLILLITAVLISGCLTVQYKEYRYRIFSDGSGTGTITFVNLLSFIEEGKDRSEADFDELINQWYKGTRLESEFKEFRITSKNLYEKEGKLYGEVKFEFENYEDAGFYKDPACDCGSYLFYIGGLSETFVESNGHYAGHKFPIIHWKPEFTEFYIKTVIQEDLSETVSLLDMYLEYKKDNQD